MVSPSFGSSILFPRRNTLVTPLQWSAITTTLGAIKVPEQ